MRALIDYSTVIKSNLKKEELVFFIIIDSS